MAEPLDEKKHFELLFVELVYSLQNMALIALGKLANPATQKAERYLPQAQATIDMLRMLKVKSQGNLSDIEQKMLERVILDLQLNYADEAHKPEPVAEKSPEKTKEGGS